MNFCFKLKDVYLLSDSKCLISELLQQIHGQFVRVVRVQAGSKYVVNGINIKISDFTKIKINDSAYSFLVAKSISTVRTLIDWFLRSNANGFTVNLLSMLIIAHFLYSNWELGNL
jgi:hypothetical protein